MKKLITNYILKGKTLKNLAFVLCAIILVTSCKNDPWDERTQVNPDVPTNNLLEEISQQTELGQFAELLKANGWDSVLTASKSYTVWAPTDAALSNLSDDILNDKEKLNLLISNHITNLEYRYAYGIVNERVKTFSGKYVNVDYTNAKANDANLSEPYDIITNNGVLHIIDKALLTTNNIWEFVETTELCPTLVSYINSLSAYVFDPTIATQIGINQEGQAIYDTSTGMVWGNLLMERTRDLLSEDSLSTLVLFADADFTSEFDKFKEYYIYRTDNTNPGLIEAKSDSVAEWKISKDIVFEGAISPEELPATLISTYGVEVPIGSFSIDSVFSASNGYVYIVSNYAIEKIEKIPVIILEGEDSTKVVGYDPAYYSGLTRERPLASGGYDFVLDNHGMSKGSITFRMPDLCAGEYNFYWVAVDDFNYSYRYPNTQDTIKQEIGWVSFTGTEDGVPQFDETEAGFKNISLDVNENVLDSTYTMAQEKLLSDAVYPHKVEYYNDYKWLRLRGVGSNTITLDYIKIVPVFND